MDISPKKTKNIIYYIIIFLASILLNSLMRVDIIDFKKLPVFFIILYYISSIGAVAILLDFFCRLKYFGYFLLVIFSIFISYEKYIHVNMGIDRSFLYTKVIVYTNFYEASSHINFQTITIFIISIITPILYIFLLKKFILKNKNKKINITEGASLAVIPLIIVGQWLIPTEGKRIEHLWPFSSAARFFLNFQKDIRERGEIIKHYASLNSPDKYPSSLEESDDGVIIVFIVGEATRPDHMSINGYSRNTTPLLLERMNKGELINFPNVISFATDTESSMTGMFTNATLENRKPTLGSFLDLFNKHQFDTGVFYNHMGQMSPAFREFTKKTKTLSLTGTYQHYLLPPLKDFLNKKEKNKIAIIQTQGSHFQYIDCYPSPEFSKFQPDQNNDWMDFQKNPDLINSFDNTIVYLDYFIEKIIQMLEDKNAILVYVADHGQSLGEGGRALHSGSMNAMEQRKVPMFIWVSSLYRKNHPNIVYALEKNSSTAISHAYLFHTIPALGGIKSSIFDSKLNLTIPHEEEQKNINTP